MKELLSRAGRTFIEKNIDEDPSAFDALAALGLMSIPVTIIGDTVVRGFDERRLRRALESLPQ